MRHGSVPATGIGNIPGKSAGFVPPGMWSEGAGAGQVQPSAPIDSFQRSSMPLQGQQGTDLHLNSGGQQSLGFGLGVAGTSQEPRLSGGLLQESNGAAPALKPQGRDDSKMIDSLFGPSEVSTKSEKDNILAGFQGLSLDEGLSSDLWANDLSQPWDPNPQGSSALLAAMQPDLAATEVQHPSRSRFGWGTSESQGQSS